MIRKSTLAGLALLLACAGGDAPEPERGERRREATTYAGDLPCADCPGQRWDLTLFPDSTFRLRRTYLEAADGRDATVYELGRWARAPDDERRIALRGESSAEFEILSEERIRMLGREGEPLHSDLPYELARQDHVDRIEGPMPLRGMYTYLADAALLEECSTGSRYPVAIEADHISLERAYLASRRAPGEPVLAALSGRFSLREPEPGVDPREHVVVERLDGVWPGGTCASGPVAARELYGTYWRVIEIDGEKLPPPSDRREPHLVLYADEGRMAGFTGCNRVQGSFEREAGGIRFGPLASTRAACPPPIGDLELGFLQALEATTALQTSRDALSLLDASGTVRMRLVARDAP